MSKQRTLVLIKPDGMPRIKDIRSMLVEKANIIDGITSNDIKKIRDLYKEHEGQFFYGYIMEHFRNKFYRAYLIEEKEGYEYKNGFFQDIIDLVGNTDTAKASPGTIRAMSDDTLDTAIKEKRGVRNIIHRSATPKDAEREIKIFFD